MDTDVAAVIALLLALGSSAIAATAILVVIVRGSAVDSLRRRVDALERALASRSSVAGAPPPAPAPEARAAEPVEPRPQAPAIPPPLPSPAAPPPEVARTSREPLPSSPRVPRIEWERWFGVKGAALLGGAVLALAGALFVQYSIQRGWIGPGMRCALAALAGLGALGASGTLRRRGYGVTSDALAGAGVVLLFTATWAARVLYELIPFWAALGAMIAVTAACGALALRRESRTIAWFGLAGGFATPLLLSLGASEPIGLFLYLLLLDAAVLAVGAKRAWPALALAASIATQLLFALWIGRHFEPAKAALALLFCGATSAIFSFGGGEKRARPLAWISAGLPFGFAIYFARQTQFTQHVLPIAALLAVLELCAAWLAWKRRETEMLVFAGVGSAASVATWMSSTALGYTLSWEAAVVLAVLAAIPALAAELAHRRDGSPIVAASAAAALVPIALCACAGGWIARFGHPAPWLAATFAIAGLWARLARIGAQPAVRLAGGVAPVLAYVAWRELGAGSALAWSSSWPEVTVAGALVVAALLASLATKDPCARTWAWRGALASAFLLAFARATNRAMTPEDIAEHLASALVPALLGLVAARQLHVGLAHALLAGASAMACARPHRLPDVWLGATPFFVVAAAGAVFALFPPIDSARAGRSRGAWRIGALAAVAWAPLCTPWWLAWRPGTVGGATQAIFGLLALFAAVWTFASRVSVDEDGRRSARSIGFVWFGCAASCLLGVALALRAGRGEWLAMFAIASALAMVVSRLARHAGARAFATALCAVLCLSLLLTFAGVVGGGGSAARTGWPVWHPLSYDSGLPALALAFSAWLARTGEPDLDVALRRIPTGIVAWLGLAAILAAFLWLNVEVVNLCSQGPNYSFGMRREPVRDVALSIAWTLYALGLLAAGVKLDRSKLRWTSLAFLLAAIGKVFLYDLGELRGLHRVASLVGLALALLAVSVVYQRFVFRRKPPAR